MSTLSAILVLPPLGDAVPKAEDVTPGWIYAAVFFAMCGLTVLLWLSMRKQLGKIHFGDKTDESGKDDSTQDVEKQDPPAAP